jgi:hypothetical protein
VRRLLKRPEVAALLAAEPPGPDGAADLKAARAYAARYALKALEQGYRSGFARGLKNDAKLFGEIAASPSGQEWIGRFIDKDPRQSEFLKILGGGTIEIRSTNFETRNNTQTRNTKHPNT